MKRVILLAFAALLTACAVPTTGIQPLPDGLHKVAHQGNGAWVTTESLKLAATNEAQDFCAKSNKTVRVIDVKHIPARPLGGWPEAEVLFKCD